MTSFKAATAGALCAIACLAGANAASADGLKDTPNANSGAKSVVVYSGSDWAPDATYSYQGVVVALNRDLGRDGVMLRLYGSHVDYEYGTGASITAGDGWQGEAMIGYKVGMGPLWAAAYIGIDYQKHKLTPDDLANVVRGTEVGFKVAADMANVRNEGPIYVSLSGNYSTAFDSYWVRGRVGGNLHQLTIGPEVAAFGNSGFDATRVGGFVTFDLPIVPAMPLELTISAGHQFISGSGGTSTGSGGGEGGYVGVAVVSVF